MSFIRLAAKSSPLSTRQASSIASATATATAASTPTPARRSFHSTSPKMVVNAINSYEEFQTILKSQKPVIIDAWATWCGPCKMISPIFEKLSEGAAKDKMDFYKLDVDEQEQITQELGIRAMPTFIVFKEGKKVHTITGADPGKLQAAVTEYSS